MPDYGPTTPGFGATRTAAHRQVMLGNERYLPGNHIIAAADARDPLNTPVTELRAGLLLGRVTASGKLGASVIGVTGEAVESDETEITVAPAVATELVRRQGATGTFKLTGPPSPGGEVRTLTATYSAVNTTTGAITVTALGASAVWTLTPLSGTDGGTFKLRVTLPDGRWEDTADISFNATGATFEAAIDTAIEALSILPDNAVTVSSTDTTGVSTMTFLASLGAVKLELIQDNLTNGGVFKGNAALVETTAGVNGEFVSGSLIQPTDGSETILTFMADGYPVKVTDEDGTERDVQLERYPVAGLVDSSQLINWPSDSSLKQWIIDALNAVGQFTFDSKHGL